MLAIMLNEDFKMVYSYLNLIILVEQSGSQQFHNNFTFQVDFEEEEEVDYWQSMEN